MKKFALLCMALISCCIFCSCGKTEPSSNEFIMLSLAISEDGMINQSIHFSVGSEKLKASGIGETEIEDFKKRLVEKIKSIHDEFYLSFLLKYAGNPDVNFQIGKALYVTAPTYTKETDTVGFNMLFTSQSAWNFYHRADQPSNQNDGSQTKRGFMITTSQSAAFPFSAMQGQTTVGARYVEIYKSALDGIELDYNPDLVYDYATPSRLLKSDSDHYFKSNLFHHVWLRKLDNLDGAKIKLYTSIPNTPIWYLALLGAVILGLGTAIIIIKIRKKKNI